MKDRVSIRVGDGDVTTSRTVGSGTTLVDGRELYKRCRRGDSRGKRCTVGRGVQSVFLDWNEKGRIVRFETSGLTSTK